MKNEKVALMPVKCFAFCSPLKNHTSVETMEEWFFRHGFSVPFENQHPFRIIIHSSRGKIHITSDDADSKVDCLQKIDGEDNCNEKKEQHWFINLQNYHILKISKSYEAIKWSGGDKIPFCLRLGVIWYPIL